MRAGRVGPQRKAPGHTVLLVFGCQFDDCLLTFLVLLPSTVQPRKLRTRDQARLSIFRV
jgi:hypothetical protein